jgi:hypothetical protein
MTDDLIQTNQFRQITQNPANQYPHPPNIKQVIKHCDNHVPKNQKMEVI